MARNLSAALAVVFVFAPLARAADVRHFDDAALRAVQFIDKNEGWAVGDDGVILHTIDGGATWDRQPSGVRGSLRSLHFLNPYTGWVAGRDELPSGGSTGILLFTRDGGLRWERVALHALPGLNHVRFLDNRVGFALGDATEQFPTGIFRTTDSGRTWKLLPGPRAGSWRCGDFSDEKTGILAGAWSKLATLRELELGVADVDALGGRSILGMQLVGPGAIAVGEGGLVLTSSKSAGSSWGFADTKLPRELRAALDFHAVHAHKDKIWIVGRPGSVVLHSADQGKSWKLQPTGQALPLHGIFFADADNGWAVGALGTVLSTTDGGQTWKISRRGGQRSAVLFVHARSAGVPVDTLADLGGQEGYLATVVRACGPDPSSEAPQRASDDLRLALATRDAGGASGEMLWQFPVPQHLSRSDAESIVKSWDKLHGDRGAEELLRQMVLAIRMWRPSVVITDHPDAEITRAPTDSVIAECLHTAFQRAADPKAFPEQLEELKLEAWQAVKLYACWHGREQAHVVMDTSAIAGRLEASLCDFAAGPARLLADPAPAIPAQRCYRLIQASGADNRALEQNVRLMQGVELGHGGSARRNRDGMKEPAPELMKAIRERRNVLALVSRPESSLFQPEQFLAQLRPTLKGMPEQQAAQSAAAVARELARTGQWPMAREVYLQLIDQYPTHPATADACRWLIAYTASSEARRRLELGQFYLVGNAVSQAVVPRAKATDQGVVPARGEATWNTTGETRFASLSNKLEARQWYQGSVEIGTRLEGLGPLYAEDPVLQFCLQSARRQLGDHEHAKQWYSAFRTKQPDGPWRDSAQTELWLASRSGRPPKPILMCMETSNRPKLDGKFDDACWQGVKPIVLKDAVGGTQKTHVTEVRMAHDKDHLYLGVTCKHPKAEPAERVKARPKDADLRKYDRVSLVLDLDRDYATYFQLQVDQRGCVCDDCWGDLTWNPRWYVAVDSDAEQWSVEAAIPLTELTGDHVSIGKAWACNVVRVIPSQGVQALSTPADVQPRMEGLGLLMFTGSPEERKPSAAMSRGSE